MQHSWKMSETLLVHVGASVCVCVSLAEDIAVIAVSFCDDRSLIFKTPPELHSMFILYFSGKV